MCIRSLIEGVGDWLRLWLSIDRTIVSTVYHHNCQHEIKKRSEVNGKNVNLSKPLCSFTYISLPILPFQMFSFDFVLLFQRTFRLDTKFNEKKIKLKTKYRERKKNYSTRNIMHFTYLA